MVESSERPLLTTVISDAVRRFWGQNSFVDSLGHTASYGPVDAALDAVKGFMQQTGLTGSEIFDQLRKQTTLKPSEVDLEYVIEEETWEKMLTGMAAHIIGKELSGIPEVAAENKRRYDEYMQ